MDGITATLSILVGIQEKWHVASQYVLSIPHWIFFYLKALPHLFIFPKISLYTDTSPNPFPKSLNFISLVKTTHPFKFYLISKTHSLEFFQKSNIWDDKSAWIYHSSIHSILRSETSCIPQCTRLSIMSVFWFEKTNGRTLCI